MRLFMICILSSLTLSLGAHAFPLNLHEVDDQRAPQEEPTGHEHEHAEEGFDEIDEESKEMSPEFAQCYECLFPNEWLRAIPAEFKGQVSAEDLVVFVDNKKTAMVTGAMTYPVLGGAKFLSGLGDPRSGGRRHQGVDLGAPTGTPVVAVWPGRVTRAGQNRLGGWSARIDHPNGMWTYYAHFHNPATVRVGEMVEAGQKIGDVGMSGNARGTTPHLHFEVHNSNTFLNPLAYIGGRDGSMLAYNPKNTYKGANMTGTPTTTDESRVKENAYAAPSVAKEENKIRIFDGILKRDEPPVKYTSRSNTRRRTFENLPGVSVEDYSLNP